jgi:RNA polymerase sigma-70 factor (ECF subfamily)
MTECEPGKISARSVPQEPADQIILDRYFSGDREAIADLANQYASRLYNFGRRMCGNPEDAQDIVQDTFLNVIKYLGGFRQETKLKNWLYRLASSACIKKRRGKNRPERELSLEDVRPTHQHGAPADIPDWTNNPVENLMNSELRAHLTSAVKRLPHKYRLVFTLRDVEGFSTQETAEILGLSPQAVKTRLHRARAFLRDELAGYFQEHGPAVGGPS